MLALARIGVHILHITLSAYQVPLSGSFRVDIEKVQLYITLAFFLFIFILLLQVLVIWFLRFVCDFRLRLL